MNQNHYYTHQPNSKSQEKHFSYVLKGFSFQFVSDNGVFSKNTIDFGSQLLIESYEVPSSFQEGKLLDVGCGYGPMVLFRSVFCKGLSEDACRNGRRQ